MHADDNILSPPTFWVAFFRRRNVIRGLKVSLIVGTILILINHVDKFQQMEHPPVWQIILTYVVPYLVSTYAAAAAASSIPRPKKE